MSIIVVLNTKHVVQNASRSKLKDDQRDENENEKLPGEEMTHTFLSVHLVICPRR